MLQPFFLIVSSGERKVEDVQYHIEAKSSTLSEHVQFIHMSHVEWLEQDVKTWTDLMGEGK
eukprot:4674893-Pyramimonas_sp.AAC.1